LRLETARAQPIEKERVVIDVTRKTVKCHSLRASAKGKWHTWKFTKKFHSQEAVLCEEVRIRKEVEQDTVEAQETLRREELDVDTQGRPVVDKTTEISQRRHL